MAKTRGRVIGVKAHTDTITTATGTLSTFVEAANESGVEVSAVVFPSDTGHAQIARSGIKVGGRWVAELILGADNSVTLVTFGNTVRQA